MCLKRRIGKKQGLAVASTIEKALLIFGREKIPVWIWTFFLRRQKPFKRESSNFPFEHCQHLNFLGKRMNP